MLMIKVYKTELDPNNKQRAQFNQFAGAARFVYNWGLADRIQKYEDGIKTSCYSQRAEFNAIKGEQCPWILDIPYAVTESAFSNLDSAYKNFFRRVKNGDKAKGFPKFKNRNKSRKSFQVRSLGVRDDSVRITKVGWVRLKERNYIPVISKDRYGVYATISESAGRWFVSVTVKEEVKEPTNDSTLVIGVDLGVKMLAVLSNGETFENPHALIEAQKKLARLEREKSRRKKGGANRQKTVEKLQRAHAKVANIRKHHLHQISHHITETLRPRTIVLEDLNVSGMMKNRNLSKAIADVGFGELRRQVEYKAEKLGIEVIIADRWYASSKTCSGCGWKNKDLTLADRIFQCPECGLEIDRDLNAALNLKGLAE